LETLQIHITGKTTKKRQNFDSFTPPAHAYHPHFMLNGETRTAPMPPPDGSAQITGEDANHKVSLAAHGTPTENPRPDQHSPLDRPNPNQGKKKKKT
jgi:hypothetical protein